MLILAARTDIDMMVDRVGSVDQIQSGKKPQKADHVRHKADSDTVALSSEAVEKADLYRAIEIVSSADDVRADRIAELKQKIKDPNYINETVVKATADRIMTAFGF